MISLLFSSFFQGFSAGIFLKQNFTVHENNISTKAKAFKGTIYVQLPIFKFRNTTFHQSGGFKRPDLCPITDSQVHEHNIFTKAKVLKGLIYAQSANIFFGLLIKPNVPM